MLICDRCESRNSVINIAIEIPDKLSDEINDVRVRLIGVMHQDLCRFCRLDLILFLQDFKKPYKPNPSR